VSVSHIKSVTIGDFTGTVTVFNSLGSTATVAASDLVRPSDWNSAHNQFFTITGNTTNASTASGSNVVLSGGPGIVLGGYTGSIVVQQAVRSGLDQFGPGAELIYATHGAGSLHLFPLRNDQQAFQFDRVLVPVSVSNATNSSGSFTVSVGLGLFTNNAGTLSLLASTSISTNFSGSGTAGSYSLYGGPRNLSIPWTTTITAPQVWQGVWSRTTTGGAAGMSVSLGWASQPANAFSGYLGAANNASYQSRLGQGIYGSSSTAIPVSVPLSTVQGTVSAAMRAPAIVYHSGTQ